MDAPFNVDNDDFNVTEWVTMAACRDPGAPSGHVIEILAQRRWPWRNPEGFLHEFDCDYVDMWSCEEV